MKISKPLIIGIAVIAIIAFFLLILSIYIHSNFKINTTSTTTYGKPYFNYSIITNGVLSYQNNRYAVPFVLINYSASNTLIANISMNVYLSNPVRNIYYVSSPSMCFDCFADSKVTNALNQYLNYYSLLENASFKVVNLNNIYSIPKKSIVIIPSGLLPVSLMPDSGYSSNTTLLTLLSNGDVVVYVGDNFSRSIGTGSIIFKTGPSSLQALGLSGINWSISHSANGNMFYFRNPTFSLGINYKNISYANVLNGTLIAFSNMPTLSWPNASSMASDITLALSTRFWMPVVAYGNYSLANPASGSVGVFALDKAIDFQNVSSINNTYVLVSAVASNSSGFIVKNKELHIFSELNGSLSMPGLIGETQVVPITIGMSASSSQRLLAAPHIDIFTSNMSYISSLPVGFFNNSVGINIIKYESFALPSGYYVAILRNFQNKPYASTLFEIAGLNISPVSLNFGNGTFVFSLSSLGMPIANSSYSISLDNSYIEKGTTSNSTIFYTLPKGSIISYGNQTFLINIFNSKYYFTTSYVKKILFIPSYYIEFAVVIIVVIVLNLVLKAPNRDEYYIDVPDFPPSKKTLVTVKKSEILNIFDKINFRLHWKYMPLLPEEIKSGITSNIKYNNMPVSITLQNVTSILTKLTNSGELINIGNYYAPKVWVELSGYSIEYLASFRRLRDYCVKAGFLFTDLGASQDADMIISRGGNEAYIFIYSTSGKRSKIKVDDKRKVYLIFFDEEAMLKFMERLYSSVSEESEALRIVISNNVIKVIDTEHLSKLII
ncbi:MAG: hypothetical protein ACP5RT_00880 [Candidatus Micrarchaeia archaeon]